MSFTVGGSTPQLTFADATVQNTAALPLTGGSVSADITVNGLTVGRGAGAVATNTSVGASALAANTSGSQNTAIGSNALPLNTTGINNTALGFYALQQNVGGNRNTGLGVGALATNSSGSSNTGVGINGLNANSTGSFNVAVGDDALISNTTASNNTAVGYQAGYTNSVGNFNTFIGFQAGYTSAATQNYTWNTCIGAQSGYYLTTGYNNTFVGGGQAGGYGAGHWVTTGSKNTILGAYTGNQGGLDIRTASNYIVLSDGDGNPRGLFDGSGNYLVGCASDVTSGGFKFFPNYSRTGSSAVEIGHITGSSSGEGCVTFKYNGSSIGSITQTGTTAVLYNTTSDYRLKTNATPIQNALETVDALNPVSFTWVDGRKDDGFIAHELQAVIPNCVTGEKDAVNEDGTPKYQQMDNSGVIPFLVKAIQELKTEFDSYKATHP